jgi:alpha-glucosidase
MPTLHTLRAAPSLGILTGCQGFVISLAFGLGAVHSSAQGQIVGETIAPGVARFFADVNARESALPSYALEKPLLGQGPAPANFPVAVSFAAEGGKHIATVQIDPNTSLYGTGEVPGQLRRNGRSTILWNTDSYGYPDSAVSLYQAHPWVLAVRPDGSAFGVIADTTYRLSIDLASTRADQILFSGEGPAFPLIIIDRASPQEVVKELAELTGKMPLPPKWALGYHQCRYSYTPEARVREVAANFRDRDIPCDVIWYDIDYYESFRVFTFDPAAFPDPKKLNADLLKDGFYNVWMINPGIKSREELSPSEPSAEEQAKQSQALTDAREIQKNRFRKLRDDGKAQDVYVKKADGSVYEGEVWPGWCFFPDYTQPRVRAWWGPWYKDFMAQGVTGVWNDMNEPAIFNVASKTMPLDNIHLGDPDMIKPSGKPQGVEGAKGDHNRYHNVYGMQMIKGTREGIAAANPDKRPFVLSRANYLGGQRYGATWTGDNVASWEHLEMSIPMSLNVGLSGQPFIGPDIGGFSGKGPVGEEGPFFARWMGFGALLPFSRGHTGKGNIDKEPWSFGPEVEETCRLALQRRSRLMPLIYTAFREASVTGLPVARPTFFADPKDPTLRSEDDSFLLGSDLLVVAQVVPDRTRVPIIPKGGWKKFDFEVPTGTKNTTKGRDGQNPDLPALYIRPGSIIPTGPVEEFIGEKAGGPLTLLVNLDASGTATGTLYEDAGDGYGYQKGEFLLSTYTAKKIDGRVEITISKADGSMKRPQRPLIVRLIDKPGVEITGSGTDGQTVTISLTPNK